MLSPKGVNPRTRALTLPSQGQDILGGNLRLLQGASYIRTPFIHLRGSLYLQTEDSSTGNHALHFSVDSHLLLELGERLVARKSVALGELVKNAYDADATRVTVRLRDVSKPGGTILVEDDGEGMTFEDVVAGWMRIATDTKLKSPVSAKYGRPRTGSKGIGRFACRVLADAIMIETVALRPSGEKERVTLSIDWTEFKPGTLVGSVPVAYSRQVVEPSTPTGLKLSLKRVRDVWTDDDILEMRRDLMTLVSPYGVRQALGDLPSSSAIEDPGFEISIDAPELEGVSGPVSEQFLKHSWGRLEGELKEDGTAKYTLEVRRAKRKYSLTAERRFSKAGPARFVVDYFVWKRDYLAGLSISVRDAQKVGIGQGGIRVYLDGFRVLTYGQPGDDWLKLDFDRGRRLTTFRVLKEVDKELERPALFLPGNNQIFGATFLSRLVWCNTSP